MQYERGVVALPFRVALGFLLLLFLWSFLGEQFTMINSNPSEYDYEVHSKASGGTTRPASRPRAVSFPGDAT